MSLISFFHYKLGIKQIDNYPSLCYYNHPLLMGNGVVIVKNIKIPNRYDIKNTYLGLAETINPNAGYDEKQVIPKIIVLQRVNNKLVPMWPDYEYHNIIDSQPAASYLDKKESGLFGYITDSQLQKAITRTGFKEADRINRNEKVLKKVA